MADETPHKSSKAPTPAMAPKHRVTASSLEKVQIQLGNIKLTGNNTSDHAAESTLSAGAADFQPQRQQKPACDGLTSDGPLIVSTPDPSFIKHVGTGPDSFVNGMDQYAYDPDSCFTTDTGPNMPFRGSHYAKVENIVAIEFPLISSILFNQFGWLAKVTGQYVPVAPTKHMTLFVRFDDFRDALSARQDVIEWECSLKFSFVSQPEYASAGQMYSGPFGGTQTNFWDGQVYFRAKFQGSEPGFNHGGVADQIYTLAKSFGEIFVFVRDPSVLLPDFKFRVEYYKISDAKVVVENLHDGKAMTIEAWKVTAHELQGPDSYEKAVNAHMGLMMFPGVVPQTSMVTGLTDHQMVSPSGRTSWTVNDRGEEVAACPPNQLPKVQSFDAAAPLSPTYRRLLNYCPTPGSPQTPHVDGLDRHEYPVFRGTPTRDPHTQATCNPFLPEGTLGEAQHVLRWKIVNGIDVRTTIMVRNLPNTLTFSGLKAILDASSFGKYDFSYLRIDFSQNKNVGYGFVNFVDPLALIEFIDAYGEGAWCPGMKDRHGRERLAKFSYATIQGFDCLVEKFRNSAIMEEFKDYRPKIWYTFENTPDQTLVGTEMEFPPSNNFSKKQRSCDNAGHLGLYSSTRKNANGNRNRYSQYDRGTSAQIQEDSFYGQMSPSTSGFGHFNIDPSYAVGRSPSFAAPPPPPRPHFVSMAPMPSMGPLQGSKPGYEQYGMVYPKTFPTSSCVNSPFDSNLNVPGSRRDTFPHNVTVTGPTESHAPTSQSYGAHVPDVDAHPEATIAMPKLFVNPEDENANVNKASNNGNSKSKGHSGPVDGQGYQSSPHY